ncbi:MAG: SIMPL domain-containing protein [Methanocellales archaeon]|nr:SIMPL domain-containing protein [Methanocellales archaeon]
MKENINLNVILVVAIIVIALVAVYSASIKPTNIGDVIITQSTQESLTVTGSYTLYADPDEANFNIEVETQAKTPIDAQEENALKMDSVKKALLGEGLKNSEIVRSSYSIRPRYNYSGGISEIVGYTATHSLNIKTTNIDSVGKYIDVAVRAGANDVGGISFGLSDEKEAELRASALKFAAESASAKANSMAEGAGVKLGEITQISEGYVGYQPVYMSAAAERGMPAPAPGIPPTSIEPGTVELSASISVTYKIG